MGGRAGRLRQGHRAPPRVAATPHRTRPPLGGAALTGGPVPAALLPLCEKVSARPTDEGARGPHSQPLLPLEDNLVPRLARSLAMGAGVSKQALLNGAIALVAAFFAAYFASPLLAAQSLRSAAREGDAERLERLVDFPTVREGLKSQINAQLMTAMQTDPEMQANPFAALALLMVPAIVERAIDAYVTPDAIGAMVTTGKAKPTGLSTTSNQAAVQVEAAKRHTPQSSLPESQQPRFDYRYKDLDTFGISTSDPEAPQSEARVHFTSARSLWLAADPHSASRFHGCSRRKLTVARHDRGRCRPSERPPRLRSHSQPIAARARRVKARASARPRQRRRASARP
ncbi:DUF2939 domain-containing protein [Phenylobacterium sp. J367]|uniref:DUF2939 domain-containing protein n=1 Tax=Phenylobacterium sp. J367 TaxID=2898435 RepID=UPI0035ADA792